MCCKNSLEQKLQKIKLLALDVDGVLTDGSINIGNEGELFKAFNAKDGLGISASLRHGLQIAIITGRKSEIIHKRAGELGITLLCEGVKDKYAELMRLQQMLKLTKAETAYIGDDLNDLPAFLAAGVAFTPNDGCDDVKDEATVILQHDGGHGAVREAVEMIFKAQNKWVQIVAGYKQIKSLGDAQ